MCEGIGAGVVGKKTEVVGKWTVQCRGDSIVDFTTENKLYSSHTYVLLTYGPTRFNAYAISTLVQLNCREPN